jgi:hypothetical protein
MKLPPAFVRREAYCDREMSFLKFFLCEIYVKKMALGDCDGFKDQDK